jgi:putative two-component system response regulator
VDREEIITTIFAKHGDGFDPGTSLFKEPYFHVLFAVEMQRIRRTGEPLTIGILLMDPLRTGGEPRPERFCEEKINALGALIKRHTREIDLATYYGGGLFALLFPKTEAHAARTAGERIRVAVETAFANDLTISLGLASFPDSGMDVAVVGAKATDACIQAAEAGGNRVRCVEMPQRPEAESEGRILVVKDEERDLKLLCAQLSPLKFEILTAATGEEALEAMSEVDVDLVIMDAMMTGMSGFDTCKWIKGNEATRQIPVILLTALGDNESRLKGINCGADDFISTPANRAELIARTQSLVKVKRLNSSLVSLENALISLANAVEAKDYHSLGHTKKVSTLAVALGTSLGLEEKDLRALYLGGILHDVGKIGVPEEILNKPGPLTEEEWTLMKRHAEIGYNICLPLLESIGPALDVIRHHHEKLDGSSYPDGLQGSGVSRIARIMGVVDCYDAMITDRPYRGGMTKARAFAILHEDVDRGRLDGLVVDALEGLVMDSQRSAV